MNLDQLTDDDIAALLALPKRVTNPSVRWQDKPGHRQRWRQVKNLKLMPSRHRHTVPWKGHSPVWLMMQQYRACYTWRTMRLTCLIEVQHVGDA